MSLMRIIIFLIYGLDTHEGIIQSWIKALILLLLTPISIIWKMLPIIVTLNLAKKAIKFSRKKVIVKILIQFKLLEKWIFCVQID